MLYDVLTVTPSSQHENENGISKEVMLSRFLAGVFTLRPITNVNILSGSSMNFCEDFNRHSTRDFFLDFYRSVVFLSVFVL